MKKLLYTALFLAAAAAVGCEDADNGASSDSAPAVTIYDTWKPADAYDVDIDCPLRIVPNAVAEELYVLAELETDKQTFVAENGADAYMQRVIDQGVCFEVGEPVEYIFKELKGDYAITAVAVAGAVRTAVEYVFNGVTWNPAGKAIGMTTAAEYLKEGGDPENDDDWDLCMNEVQLYRKSNANEFYIANFFEQVSAGYGDYALTQEQPQRLYLTFDENNQIVAFEPEGGTFIFSGNYPMVGYWVPDQYSNYCFTKNDETTVQISALWVNVESEALYTNFQIILDTTDVDWYVAE